MPNTTVAAELRDKAARLIEAGKLPSDGAHLKLWGGQGNGDICIVCGQPITPEQVQYEVEDRRGERTSFYFHMVCHAAWQLECGARNPRQPDAGPNSGARAG